MKLNLISIAILAALGASAGAQAAQVSFTFDPTGTAGAAGDIADVGIIDWAPGTGYAEGAVTAIQNFGTGGPTGFTLYYQANLSLMQGFDTSFRFANGQGGDFFTAVSAFGEKVLSVGANQSATFGFDPTNPVNFFKIYAAGSIANNLAGTGFVTATPILQAHLTQTDSSNFTVQSTTPVTLDQGGGNGDQWGGQQSVTGSGSSDLTFVVDSIDANYFPDLNLAQSILMSLFNTSQVDPFNQVDPSQCVNTDTDICGGVGGGITTVGTLGALNGASGPSFIFQADGNQSFATVPEPGSLALLGLGMAALGFSASRRKAS